MGCIGRIAWPAPHLYHQHDTGREITDGLPKNRSTEEVISRRLRSKDVARRIAPESVRIPAEYRLRFEVSSSFAPSSEIVIIAYARGSGGRAFSWKPPTRRPSGRDRTRRRIRRTGAP